MTRPADARPAGTQRSEVNPNPHEAERRIALEAAYREGYDAGTCDGQALDAVNDPDSAWADSQARALLTTKTGE